MEKEKELTPEASLKLIRESIASSRKNFRNSSAYYLLWGWVVIIASVIQYFILRKGIADESFTQTGLFSALNWIILTLAALIIQYFIIRKQSRKQRVYTYLDRFHIALWACSGFVLMLMIFLSFMVGSYPGPFILALIAVPTTVSGIITRFTPLIFGGIVFVLGAIVAVFFQNEYQTLINAIIIMLGYLVPGYILRYSKND